MLFCYLQVLFFQNRTPLRASQSIQYCPFRWSLYPHLVGNNCWTLEVQNFKQLHKNKVKFQRSSEMNKYNLAHHTKKINKKTSTTLGANLLFALISFHCNKQLLIYQIMHYSRWDRIIKIMT